MNLKIFRRMISCFPATGISAWLLGTVEGAAWAIRTIAHQAGAEIEFSRIEGRLWNAVRLEGVEATWHQGHANAERLFFQWHPLMAITGNIAVKRLSVNNVVIQDDRPEENKPPDLSWPKVNGIPAKLDAWIDTLEITGLDCIRLNNTPFTVRNASALVIWHKGMISLRNFVLSTPGIGVTGTVEAGFLHPSFLADFTASPVQSLQDINRFSLTKPALCRDMALNSCKAPLQSAVCQATNNWYTFRS